MLWFYNILVKIEKNWFKIHRYIRNYFAGGILDQFTNYFGHSDDKRVESFFPYQFVTVQNWKDGLYKSEPFTQESFYSALTKTTISDDDYKTYLEDSKNFKKKKKKKKKNKLIY